MNARNTGKIFRQAAFVCPDPAVQPRERVRPGDSLEICCQLEDGLMELRLDSWSSGNL